jgi:iron complex outermembrane receptor protein
MINEQSSRAGRMAGRHTVLVLGSALILSAALPAAAQTAPSAESGQLEEVTVTARYTKENLQETPLAITAVTGDSLRERSITSISDLGSLVPNLYTHPGDQEEGPTPTISMRGVTAGDYSFARDPAVGIYIDDVYHSTMVGADLDLSDLDRVEVKRGPQGTLAGNASIAGTISLFSKPPKGDDTGYISAGYGSYNEVDVKGAFDTTIAPGLYARISGQSKRQDGYVDQLDFTCEMNALGTPQLAGTFPTSDIGAKQRGCKIGSFGGTNISSEKLILRYVASDKLEFNLTGSYFDEKDEAAPEVLVATTLKPNDNNGSVINNAIMNAYGVSYDSRFLAPPGQPYSSYANFCRPAVVPGPGSGFCWPNAQGQTSADFSLKADYDITNTMHLKAIGAYSNFTGLSTNATDVSPLGFVRDLVFFNTTQYTGEVRINGTSFDNKLDWVGGIFVLSSVSHLSGDIFSGVASVFTESDYFHTDSQSAFLHGDYKITDRWSVSAGARYTMGNKTDALDHPQLFTDIIPFSVRESHVDWLASTDYKITGDLMGYLTVSTGSRPPGISTVVQSKYQLSPFPAEELTAYELGAKSEFFNHRLRLNADVFYSDYKSRLTSESAFECLGQAPPPTPVLLSSLCPAGGFKPWTLTIGTPAAVKGVELEATAEPIDGLLLNLDAGFNHVTSLVDTLGQPGYVVPGNLPQPEWNVSGGIQDLIPVPGGALTPRLDWVYESLQTFNPASANTPSTPIYNIPAHSVFNGRIAYTPTQSKWSVVLSATNLLNKFYLYDKFTGPGFSIAGNAAPPREWMVTLRHDF